MALWQPRSVLQLVLIGFFAVLAPLGVAILYTVQTLETLAQQSANASRRVIEVTRLGQEVQAEAVEMERHARQYLALYDPDIGTLFYEEKGLLLGMLRDLGQRLGETAAAISDLQASIAPLRLPPPPAPGTSSAEPGGIDGTARPLDQGLQRINDQRRDLQSWLRAYVDQLLADNTVQATTTIDALVLQLSFLALATLVLLALFVWRISRPVQQLTREIDRLGTAGLAHTIAISGPQEVEELGRKLEWLRQRLHESEQQKQQFLRHISHELKTPLYSLREGADLLSEHVTGRLSQRQQEVVGIVRENAVELQRLIENLIDYNQLPRQELNPEAIDLPRLCADLLATYHIAIEQKDLDVRSEGTVDLWNADRAKLKTTLDNLISNAVNYTPEGGHIEVTWLAESASLVLDVANSGDPIPAEDTERVFEPFFQSSARRSGPIKGSGIGLSVARECMQAQGGSLALVDHPTLPVCFRLVCPSV